MAKSMDWKRAAIRASNYRAALGDHKGLPHHDPKHELAILARGANVPTKRIAPGKRTMAPQAIDKYGKLR